MYTYSTLMLLKPEHSRKQDQYNGCWCRADSRFVPSQWETELLCNDVSHCLGAILESALWCPWSFCCRSSAMMMVLVPKDKKVPVFYKERSQILARNHFWEIEIHFSISNKYSAWAGLTQWGRVTYICISRLTIIGSDNGLSPDWR